MRFVEEDEGQEKPKKEKHEHEKCDVKAIKMVGKNEILWKMSWSKKSSEEVRWVKLIKKINPNFALRSRQALIIFIKQDTYDFEAQEVKNSKFQTIHISNLKQERYNKLN